jgi:hypothetical protein
MTDDLPFERAPRETVKAWTACLEYCRLGRERSSERVRLKFGYTTARLLERWASRWGWPARAALWDAQEQKRVLKLWQDRRDEVRQADWDMANKLRLKVQDMLAMPVVRKYVKEDDGHVTIIEPARWTQGDTARIADTASKLARLAALMETERKVTESDIDAELERILTSVPPHTTGGDAGSRPEESGAETTEPGETS